jgi:hypothetical protein
MYYNAFNNTLGCDVSEYDKCNRYKKKYKRYFVGGCEFKKTSGNPAAFQTCSVFD